MDNTTLIAAFVDGVVTHRTRSLVNRDLRVAATAGHWQLSASSEGLIAISTLAHSRPRVAVRYRSPHWQTLHESLLQVRYLPTGKSSQRAGFYEYQRIDIPPGYHVQFTDALDIMQAWWSYQSPEKPASLITMLVLYRGTWHPIREVTSDQGTLLIHTLGHVVKLLPLERLAWLQRRNVEQWSRRDHPQGSDAIALPPIRHRSDSQNHPAPTPSGPQARSTPSRDRRPAPLRSQPSPRKIGSYLVEAALLTSAQVEVALRDQRSTGLKFGEILVQRGWLKQKTIEFLMEQVILPQRAAARATPLNSPSAKGSHASPQPRQTLIESASTSIHSRETLITDPVISETTPDLAAAPPYQSPASTIHDRATLITDALDVEAEINAHQPVEAPYSIHDRATLITDPIAEPPDTGPSKPSNPDAVHSRDTLITEDGLT